MVYNLLHYEGLFVGASSALNAVGAVKTAEAMGKGKTVGGFVYSGALSHGFVSEGRGGIWRHFFFRPSSTDAGRC